jgi:hypothetical protein
MVAALFVPLDRATHGRLPSLIDYTIRRLDRFVCAVVM